MLPYRASSVKICDMAVDPALRNVIKRTQAHDRTGAARDEAIRAAHKAGHSLRAIAEAARLSHEQVRRIVRSGH